MIICETGGIELTAGANVKMNICIESSVAVLRSEGAPYRIKGGTRDIGLHLGGYGFGMHDDDPSDEIVHEDSGAESESTENNRATVETSTTLTADLFPASEDGAVTIAEDGVVSVSVGLPRRFGNPEDTETVENNPGEGILREILRKVTVNETMLQSAIESLGGGVKGLKAVVRYVKHFQETRDPNAGTSCFFLPLFIFRPAHVMF